VSDQTAGAEHITASATSDGAVRAHGSKLQKGLRGIGRHAAVANALAAPTCSSVAALYQPSAGRPAPLHGHRAKLAMLGLPGAADGAAAWLLPLLAPAAALPSCTTAAACAARSAGWVGRCRA
jgi:hypothetical protein